MAELIARAAFDGLLTPQGTADGVRVRALRGLGVASVLAAGAAALPWPDAPRRIEAEGLTVLGVSRGAWLAIGEGGTGLATALAARLAGAAHVADQSGAYGILEIDGPHAGDLLAKGLNVDLHESAFAADAVAVSRIAQIGVTLWRCGAGSGYRLATPRSSAGSFVHWLNASAAAYGLAVL